MDKDTMIILVCGTGIFLGFFAFVSYLAFLSSRQQDCPSCEPAQTYVPVYAPRQEKPTETKEVRPTRPHIINHALNEANRWYEIPIPKGIRAWSMKTRGVHELNYSFEPSHSTYITLERGQVVDQDTSPTGVFPTAVYVMSEDAGTVVELQIWG